jgi:starch synthase
MEELDLHYQEGVPLIGLVSRLTWQKGISLMQDVLADVLRHRRAAFAALGSGEPRYEQFLTDLQRQFPGRVCFYNGYSNKLAHMIEAGADLFLMPSAFEPCGLNQIYSLKYGTIPIVHETGGLKDSVELYDPDHGTGTGIVFKDFNAEGLRWALNTALDLYQDKKTWRKLMRNAMAQDFAWDKQGQLYVDLYSDLVESSRGYVSDVLTTDQST